MTKDAKDAAEQEHDLLAGAMPPLNEVGGSAVGNSIINRAVKAQLALVVEWGRDYVDTEGRDYGHGQMPHEWGSMDSYDDMRNSLRAASVLLEEVLDAPDDDEGQREICRRACAEGGYCAVADGVEALAYTGATDEVRNAEREAWEDAHPEVTAQMERNQEVREAIRHAPVEFAELLAYYTEEGRVRGLEKHEEIMAKIASGEL